MSEEQLIPFEEVLEKAIKDGYEIPKEPTGAKEIKLDKNDLHYMKKIKIMQTAHNLIMEQLTELKKQLDDFSQHIYKGLSAKHRINTGHYTFSEIEEKLIKNFGNEQKIFNTRLMSDINMPELRSLVKSDFKSLYSNIVACYNELERTGAFK